MTYSLTWLPEVLRAAGLKVQETDGWQTRGHGDMGTVQGVLCHETDGAATGNMPTLQVLIDGRPDLGGPLSQLGLGRDGTFYIVAAGKGWHAGAGGPYRGITDGNAALIGIEAEHQADEAWTPVQLDAYQRGVAAILKHIGTGAEMVIGHKEWAPGRKDDPKRIDMGKFRAAVALILAGAPAEPAPMPQTVPADAFPVTGKGDTGQFVKTIQVAVGVPVDGDFGKTTEAAVAAFQAARGLRADGIVGPETWPAIVATGALLPAPTAPDAQNLDLISRITQIASQSAVAKYPWENRGVAPPGYPRGMAVMFATAYCALRAGAPYALDMVGPLGNDDAIAWYGYSSADWNAAAPEDRLAILFALVTGLGMRESGGGRDIGRDRKATNVTADKAEAGIWQASWNFHVASPFIVELFKFYATRGADYASTFYAGIKHNPQDLECFGDGDGAEYQRLAKASPAFACITAAISLRHIGGEKGHWGPIRRREAELRPEGIALFRAIAHAIDADLEGCIATLCPELAKAPTPVPPIVVQPAPVPPPVITGPTPGVPPVVTPAPAPPPAPAPTFPGFPGFPSFPAFPPGGLDLSKLPIPISPEMADQIGQQVEAIIIAAVSARNPLAGPFLKAILDASRTAFMASQGQQPAVTSDPPLTLPAPLALHPAQAADITAGLKAVMNQFLMSKGLPLLP